MGEGPAPGFFWWACKGLGTSYRGKDFFIGFIEPLGAHLKAPGCFVGLVRGY